LLPQTQRCSRIWRLRVLKGGFRALRVRPPTRRYAGPARAMSRLLGGQDGPICTKRIEKSLRRQISRKVLLGRWLLTRPKILILDEPNAWGWMSAPKAEIHQLIAASGQPMARPVLMISSEMPEVLGHEPPYHGDA